VFSWSLSLLIVFGILIDQGSKVLAEARLSFYSALEMIPSVLSLQLVHNYGAAYGIFQDKRVFLLATSILVIGACILFQKQLGTTVWSRFGVSFLMMGAAGNFLDRLFRGFVVDFIDIRIVPVFNFADIFINVSIVLFLLDLIKSRDTSRIR
jgi:signal peptidase II